MQEYNEAEVARSGRKTRSSAGPLMAAGRNFADDDIDEYGDPSADDDEAEDLIDEDDDEVRDLIGCILRAVAHMHIHSGSFSWLCCCAIRASVDLLYAIHYSALGISPVISFSGVKKHSGKNQSRLEHSYIYFCVDGAPKTCWVCSG